MVVQRVAGAVETYIFRQLHREFVIWNRYNSAGSAMNHRDRTAPVSLAADAPIAQPPVHHLFADAATFQLRDRPLPRRVGVEPVEESGVDHGAGADIGDVADDERFG